MATFEEGQGPVATWMGDEPTMCQITGTKIDMVFIDGRTKMGPWAIMSPQAHAEYGVGLGFGRGQRYMKYGDKWVKVEG